MTATQPTKASNKSSNAPARPVTNVLLELAYMMHATKAIGVREDAAPRQNANRTS